MRRPSQELIDAVYEAGKQSRSVVEDVLTALLAVDPWKPAEDAPTDGRVVTMRSHHHVRFKAYQPGSTQLRRGIPGRWQQLNQYGGWDNITIEDMVDYREEPNV